MRGTYFLIDHSLESTVLDNTLVIYSGTGKSYTEITLNQLLEDNKNDRVGRIRGIEWIFVASNHKLGTIITFRQEPWELSIAYFLYISILALSMVFGFCIGKRKQPN